jgi:hypothetical protein
VYLTDRGRERLGARRLSQDDDGLGRYAAAPCSSPLSAHHSAAGGLLRVSAQPNSRSFSGSSPVLPRSILLLTLPD